MQEKKKQPKQDKTEEQIDDLPAADQEAKDKLDYDVDDLLAEIDDVLEVEAEAFVKAFIQKGGQ